MDEKPRLYKGYWFLPSDPEKQIAGVLTINPDGKAVLELIGAFEGSSFYSSPRYYMDTIWGQCYDDNKRKGTIITLLNCPASYTYNSGLGFPLVYYSAHIVLTGIHAHSDQEPVFYRSLLHFKELSARPILSILCVPGL